MDKNSKEILSRSSFAAAVFGAACNLLFVILEFYQDDSLQYIRSNGWRPIIGVYTIMSAPLLVLLAFRHYLAVTIVFAPVLFSLLVWRIEYPHQYYIGQKWDSPGVSLIFLGLVSAGIFSAWAVVRLFVTIWRALKPDEVERS